MASRTIRLMGKAFASSGSVSLVVNWNGSQVFSGQVPTSTDSAPEIPSVADMGILASWSIDTADIGTYPLSIAVSGGTLQFHDLKGNYSGYESHLTTADNEVPGTLAGELVVDTQPVDFFGDLNTNGPESDGKTNVSVIDADGDAPSRQINEEDHSHGDWIYTIADGSTFNCDFVVSAENLVTSVS